MSATSSNSTAVSSASNADSGGSVGAGAASASSTPCQICCSSTVEADPEAQRCILRWLSLLADNCTEAETESGIGCLSLTDLADGFVLLNLLTRVDPQWTPSDGHGPLDSALPRFACLEEYLDRAFQIRFGSVRVLDWDCVVAASDDSDGCQLSRRDWELLKACVLLLAAWLRQPRTLEVAAAAADALPDELQPRAVSSLRPLLSLPEGVGLTCALFHGLLLEPGNDNSAAAAAATDAAIGGDKNHPSKDLTAACELLDISTSTTTDGRDAENAAYWLEVRLRTSELTRCRLEARVAELECQSARAADAADELRAALEDALADAKRSRRRAVEASRTAERQSRLDKEAAEKIDRLQAEIVSLNVQLEEASQLLCSANKRENVANDLLGQLRQELASCRCRTRRPACSDVGVTADSSPVTIDRSVEAHFDLPKPSCHNKKVNVCLDPPRPVCVSKEVETCLDPPRPVCVSKEVEACLDPPRPVCVSKEVEAYLDPPRPICVSKAVETYPSPTVHSPQNLNTDRDVEQLTQPATASVRFSVDSPSQALLEIGKQVQARLDQTFDRFAAVTSASVDTDDLDEVESEEDELLSELNYRGNNDDSFRMGGARRLSSGTVRNSTRKPTDASQFIANEEEELQPPVTSSSLIDAPNFARCKRELDLAKATNSALVARIDDLTSQLTRSRQQYQQLAAAAAAAAASRRWSPVFPRQQQRRQTYANEALADDADSLSDQRQPIGGWPSLAEEEAAMWRAAERRNRLAKRRRASLHSLAALLHPASPVAPPPPPPPSLQQQQQQQQLASASRVASWLATPGRQLKRIGAAGRRFRTSVGTWDVS